MEQDSHTLPNLADLSLHTVKDERNQSAHASKSTREEIGNELLWINSCLDSPNALIDWCLRTGLMTERIICSSCGSAATEWVTGADDRYYWVCSSRSKCTASPVNASQLQIYTNTRKLLCLLFTWYYRNFELTSKVYVTKEELENFSCAMSLMSLYECQKLSRKVGGRRIRVNVEAAENTETKLLVVAGMEECNRNGLFVATFDLNKITKSELKEEIKKYIEAGSLVFTTSTGTMFEDFKWNYCPKRKFNFGSKYLSEDVWRMYLSKCQDPFCELAKTLGRFNREYPSYN